MVFVFEIAEVVVGVGSASLLVCVLEKLGGGAAPGDGGEEDDDAADLQAPPADLQAL